MLIFNSQYLSQSWLRVQRSLRDLSQWWVGTGILITRVAAAESILARDMLPFM
jgi:hypothetical protein